MTKETKITVIGAGAILLLDCVAAWLAHAGGFSVVLFFPFSVGVYFLVAYRAARYLTTSGAIAFGAFLGLVDSTIGCKLSTWIAPDAAATLTRQSFNQWCGMIIWVMIFGIIVSLSAYLIATRPRKRDTDEERG